MSKSKALAFIKGITSDFSSKGVLATLFVIIIVVAFLSAAYDLRDEYKHESLTTVSSSVDPKLSRVTVKTLANTKLIESIQCTYDGDILVTVPRPRMAGHLPEYMDTESLYKDFSLIFVRDKSNPSDTIILMPDHLTDILRVAVPEPEFRADMQAFFTKAATLCSHAYTTLSSWKTE